MFIILFVASFNMPAYAQETLWRGLIGKADTFHQQRRYSEALLLYKEALKICENTFGPDHSGVATTLGNMSALYKNIGKDDEAEKLLERAKGIRSKQQSLLQHKKRPSL